MEKKQKIHIFTEKTQIICKYMDKNEINRQIYGKKKQKIRIFAEKIADTCG